MRDTLLQGQISEDNQNQRVYEEHLLDDNELPWYTPLGTQPVLAVHQALVPDLISLIDALHAHPGVASTLVLIRERFLWPNMARDVREYVLLCGCRRRKKSTSQKIVMPPGRAIQPWDVLEVGSTSLGVKSLVKNKSCRSSWARL